MNDLSDIIKESIETTGYNIQPYKFNIMMKTASKIINTIVSIPEFMVNFRDVEFILEIVLISVRRARAEGSKQNEGQAQ